MIRKVAQLIYQKMIREKLQQLQKPRESLKKLKGRDLKTLRKERGNQLRKKKRLMKLKQPREMRRLSPVFGSC